MWLFKKKKYYKVVWKYDATSPYRYVEYVKATNVADAWKKIRNQHSLYIHCDDIVEVNEDGYPVDGGRINETLY